MIESNEREASGFVKTHYLQRKSAEELEKQNQQLAKVRSGFVLYYLLAHILAAPMLILIVVAMIRGGTWGGPELVLGLGLVAVLILNIIIWTRTGSDEEVINSRSPWVGAVILVSFLIFTLAMAVFD